MYPRNQMNPRLLLFFVVAGIILLAIILLTVVLSFRSEPRTKITPTEQPAPTTVIIDDRRNLNDLQKATIGSSMGTQLESRSDFINKQVLPSGEIEYSFISEIDVRPNIVLTDSSGVVILERVMIPSEPGTTGYVLISQYKTKYGEPEADLAGSHFYDWAIHTYIYASRGFALVGNPNNDEVYEIHTFQPMSVDEYKTKFGQDINPNAQPDRKY